MIRYKVTLSLFGIVCLPSVLSGTSHAPLLQHQYSELWLLVILPSPLYCKIFQIREPYLFIFGSSMSNKTPAIDQKFLYCYLKMVNFIISKIYFNLKLGQNSQTFLRCARLKNIPLRKETLYINKSCLKCFSLDDEKPTEQESLWTRRRDLQFLICKTGDPMSQCF